MLDPQNLNKVIKAKKGEFLLPERKQKHQSSMQAALAAAAKIIDDRTAAAASKTQNDQTASYSSSENKVTLTFSHYEDQEMTTFSPDMAVAPEYSTIQQQQNDRPLSEDIPLSFIEEVFEQINVSPCPSWEDDQDTPSPNEKQQN